MCLVLSVLASVGPQPVERRRYSRTTQSRSLAWSGLGQPLLAQSPSRPDSPSPVAQPQSLPSLKNRPFRKSASGWQLTPTKSIESDPMQPTLQPRPSATKLKFLTPVGSPGGCLQAILSGRLDLFPQFMALAGFAFRSGLRSTLRCGWVTSRHLLQGLSSASRKLHRALSGFPIWISALAGAARTRSSSAHSPRSTTGPRLGLGRTQAVLISRMRSRTSLSGSNSSRTSHRAGNPSTTSHQPSSGI